MIAILAPSLVTAQTTPKAQPSAQAQPLNTVEVRAAGQAPVAEDALGSVTIGRSEITRYGAGSLADVLRRLPGVSVTQGAAGAEVRLRGLGTGYTQILLNGVATPPAFTIDSVPPESIERIEIIRGGSAEYGSQAIAGSINIVLKQAIRSDEKEFKAGLSSSNGRASYHASGQLSHRAGDVALSMAATADRLGTSQHSEVSDSGSEAGSSTLFRDGARERRDDVTRLSLTPRVVIQATDADRLTLEAFLFHNQIDGTTYERNVTPLGPPLLYENSDFFLHYKVRQQRLSGSWERDLDSGARLTARLTKLWDNREIQSRLLGRDPSLDETLDRNVLSRASDTTSTLQFKYTAPVAKGHEAAAGLEGSRLGRDENRIQRDIVALSAPPSNTDEMYTSSVRKLAAYAQDQWTLSNSLEVYLGLRWEAFQTRTTGNMLDSVQSDGSVVSPVVQVKWKPTERPKDLMRFSLGRTYKAPTPAELMPRRYIAKNNGPTTPDYQGNPELRPELAWSADLSYERREEYGSLSATAYAKRINDVMRDEVIYRDGTWITRPINGGAASVLGLELEGRTTVTGSLGKASLRASLARNWSRLDQLPAPDNNLAQQVPLTLTIGTDLTWADSSWAAGGTLRFVGGAQHRLTLNQSSGNGDSRGLDLYVVKKVGGRQAVRLSAQNLFGGRERSNYRYFDQTVFSEQQVSKKASPTFRVDVELKL